MCGVWNPEGLAALCVLVLRSGDHSKRDLVNDWLTVEESARLLKAIFPLYPQLWPREETPPKETWKWNTVASAK